MEPAPRQVERVARPQLAGDDGVGAAEQGVVRAARRTEARERCVGRRRREREALDAVDVDEQALRTRIFVRGDLSERFEALDQIIIFSGEGSRPLSDVSNWLIRIVLLLLCKPHDLLCETHDFLKESYICLVKQMIL